MDRDFVSRGMGRFVPSTSVTVALLESNLPIAYGVIRDLSEIGACIMTNAALSPGKSYQFRMSFFGGEVLEAEATVIWSEAARPNRTQDAEIPHGLKFSDINQSHLENLKRILNSQGFGTQEPH